LPSLLKPTNGVNTDYQARIGALFDAFNNGNYNFPAVQVPSADPNTLDDYEEGTWTPSLTFVTPGDLAVAYSVRSADYTKIGRSLDASFVLVTSSFTKTTASGNAQISGLPFVANPASNTQYPGPLLWAGITKAGYTSFVCRAVQNVSTLDLAGSGSGVAFSLVAAGDMPSGGAPTFAGSVTYFTV
jgi:hypothetical protein